MDAQLKRGFLEVCVLASISQHDSYGYQIQHSTSPERDRAPSSTEANLIRAVLL